MEIFKTIKHHPIYEISNKGTVRNKQTGDILKATPHPNHNKNNMPYLRIELKRPKRKYFVHRLVAEAFIPNTQKYKTINHRDENGTNNNVENLEWCSNKYNCVYSQGKKVLQYTLDGELINSYNSLMMAANKTGSDFRLISAVCLGKRNKHNNFIWKYYD